MLKGKKISVVIPCKNEEKIIRKTIKGIPHYVDEIIVVDNGSTDESFTIAQDAGAMVYEEPRKLNGVGYGYAHITGLKHAHGDFIVGMDADGTYPASEIKEIVNQMEKNGWDFVSCNRLPLKNPKAISRTRRLGIEVLNLEVLFLYGKHIQDILTGMWVVRKSKYRALDLKMGDWNLSPEIKLSAMTNPEVSFSEYHIDHFEREKEPSKQQIWKTGVNHLLYIFERRFFQDSKLGHWLYCNVLKRPSLMCTYSRSGTGFII